MAKIPSGRRAIAPSALPTTDGWNFICVYVETPEDADRDAAEKHADVRAEAHRQVQPRSRCRQMQKGDRDIQRRSKQVHTETYTYFGEANRYEQIQTYVEEQQGHTNIYKRIQTDTHVQWVSKEIQRRSKQIQTDTNRYSKEAQRYKQIQTDTEGEQEDTAEKQTDTEGEQEDTAEKHRDTNRYKNGNS
eukprot:gene4651-3942_t